MRLILVALLFAISYAQTVGDGCAVNLVGENWRCTGTVQRFNRETLQLCADEAWTLNAPFFTFRENKRKCEVPTDDPALQCGDDANQGANTWSTFSIDCPPPTFGPTMEPTEPDTCGDSVCDVTNTKNEKADCPQDCESELIADVCDCIVAADQCDGKCVQIEGLSGTCSAYQMNSICGGIIDVDALYWDVCPNKCTMKCSPNMENPLGLVCNMGTGTNGDNVADGVWDSPCGGIENRMYCPIQDTTTPIMCNNGNCESTAADCFANGGVKYGDVPCGTYPWDVVKIQKIFDNTGNSRENRFKGIGRRVRKVLRNNQLEDGSPVFAKWIWRRMRDIVKNDGFSKQNFNRLNKKFENLKDFFVAMN